MRIKRKTPAEEHPRYEGGFDHGAAGTVLARSSRGKLVWRRGHSWTPNSLSGRKYAPVSLQLHYEGVRGTPREMPKTILEGGRLTRERLTQAVMELIRRELKVPELEAESLVQAHRSRATLVVLDGLPDLRMTEAVLRAYDLAGDDELARRLAEVIGLVFGWETRDRNDPETCRLIVRPGPPEPPLGETDVSHVRRMVREWREARDAEG